jgi:hypothetical protein
MSCTRNLCPRKIVEGRKLEKKKMEKSPQGGARQIGFAAVNPDLANKNIPVSAAYLSQLPCI